MLRKTDINGKLVQFAWWALATIVFTLIVAIRIRLLGIPLERDEGEYAYAGQLILQGIPPYKLAYNMKFPGTYAAYALIMSIFGQTIVGIHIGLLLINAAINHRDLLHWPATVRLAGRRRRRDNVRSCFTESFGIGFGGTRFAICDATGSRWNVAASIRPLRSARLRPSLCQWCTFWHWCFNETTSSAFHSLRSCIYPLQWIFVAAPHLRQSLCVFRSSAPARLFLSDLLV